MTDTMQPSSGNVIAKDGKIVNLVDLLGGGTPIEGMEFNVEDFSPRSGLVIGSDGKVYDLVELIKSGGTGSDMGDVSEALDKLSREKVDKSALMDAGIMEVERTVLLDNVTIHFQPETDPQGLDGNGKPKWYISDDITKILPRADIRKNSIYDLIVDGKSYVFTGEYHPSDYPDFNGGWHDSHLIGNARIFGRINYNQCDNTCDMVIANRFKADYLTRAYCRTTEETHTISLIRTTITNKVDIPAAIRGLNMMLIHPGSHLVDSGPDSNMFALCLGPAQDAKYDGDIAIGYGALADGQHSLAMGAYAHASAPYAFALGPGTKATGQGSVAFNQVNEAAGTMSAAMGQRTLAKGGCSVAEGYASETYGSYSHAGGSGSVTFGSSGLAFGLKTISVGNQETVLGKYNEHQLFLVPDEKLVIYNAQSTYSFSSYKVNTKYSLKKLLNVPEKNIYFHFINVQVSKASVVSNKVVKGEYLTAEEIAIEITDTDIFITFLKSPGQYFTMEFSYTNQSIEYPLLMSVGNGVSDTERSNAYTLDKQGNGWFQGDVYVGGTSQNDEKAERLAKMSDLPETEELIFELSDGTRKAVHVVIKPEQEGTV